MISIIIPTYNRYVILLRTLGSIEQQNFSKDDFEVIVVDDGSADDTVRYLEEFRRNTKINFSYYRQDNAGPAQARNTGIKKAVGDIILFCGDDTIFDKEMLRQHYLFHEKYPGKAVLGLVLWDEQIKPTDFMHFLASRSLQFHYNTIKNTNDAKFTHFYTANISLAKEWLTQCAFSQSFKYAAFEDIELGFELEQRGLKIVYNKDAVVYHAHFYTPEVFLKRIMNVGKSVVVFKERHRNKLFISLKLNAIYTPFIFFPWGLRLFNIMTGLLAKNGILKRMSCKAHWFFSIAYFYSTGILDELRSMSVEGARRKE